MTEKDTTASNIAGGAPSPMELVQEFHRTYSMPIRPFDDPTLSYDRLGMRMSLIEAADALADLIYVIYGMAIESGMDLDSVLAEVQASNLSKLMPDGTVKLREDGKVLKGPNFFPPNVARGLGLEQA